MVNLKIKKLKHKKLKKTIEEEIYKENYNHIYDSDDEDMELSSADEMPEEELDYN